MKVATALDVGTYICYFPSQTIELDFCCSSDTRSPQPFDHTDYIKLQSKIESLSPAAAGLDDVSNSIDFSPTVSLPS